MSVAAIVCLAGLAAIAIFLASREIWRRCGIVYEYRWQTFAVRRLGRRQLLHIRASEISSIKPLAAGDRLVGPWRFKWLIRSGLGRKVVIRSTIAHARPVVVSWEGRLIAGLKPQGCKLRSEDSGPRG